MGGAAKNVLLKGQDRFLVVSAFPTNPVRYAEYSPSFLVDVGICNSKIQCP